MICQSSKEFWWVAGYGLIRHPMSMPKDLCSCGILMGRIGFWESRASTQQIRLDQNNGAGSTLFRSTRIPAVRGRCPSAVFVSKIRGSCGTQPDAAGRPGEPWLHGSG